MNIKLATDNRKAVATRLAEITGTESHYTKAPRFAYEIGPYSIEKDGSLITTEGADLQPLLTLADEGMIENFTTPNTEPINVTVKVPIEKHTGNSLRNLINLVYTRAALINKALGTSFSVGDEFIEALKDDEKIKILEDCLEVIKEHSSELTGISVDADSITFNTLPETADADEMNTFTVLCGMMSKQAQEQKRIQAKAINEDNEKYALRIWLTRLGMNGPEYKEARRILMANLSGNAAFRTSAEEAKWKERQAQKKAAVKAASEDEA